MLGMESMNGRMSRLAKDEMNIGRFYSLKDILREIDSVTTHQIQKPKRALKKVQTKNGTREPLEEE